MKLRNAVLAIALAAGAPAQVLKELPPPPPTLRLSKAEDDALRAASALWMEKRAVKASPLVITRESLAYDPAIEPFLRLELLRRNVSAATTERLLTALRERNVHPWSIEAPALEGATRIRFIEILLCGLDPKSPSDRSLQNLGEVRALAVPGVAEDAAIVLHAVGPQIMENMYAAARLAFVERGIVAWEQQFGEHDLEVDRDAPREVPHQALFTVDDRAVIRALLDRRFPDHETSPLVVNETRMVGLAERSIYDRNEFSGALQARNEVPLFIPALDVGRKVTMVPRERLYTWHSSDLKGAPGIIKFSLPAYSSDHQRAAIMYTTLIPRDGAVEVGGATAFAQRTPVGWNVVRDPYHMFMTTKSDPNAPIRVGGDVKAPLPIERVEPRFPPGTTSGLIILEIIVDRDGRVTKATPLTSRGAAADQAAVAAVRQWKFQPGTLNGKPVPVIYNVVVRVP